MQGRSEAVVVGGGGGNVVIYLILKTSLKIYLNFFPNILAIFLNLIIPSIFCACYAG